MPDPISFEELLAMARRGDLDALGQLLEQYRSYLLVVAQVGIDGKLQPKIGASDLVQDSLLEAQRDFASFEGGEVGLKNWLHTILDRNLKNVARGFCTAKRDLNRERAVDKSVPDPSADLTSPSEAAIRTEETELLHRALDQLPEDYRMVLLGRARRLSFDELGKQLGNRSADAARMLWGRALEALRGHIEKRQ